MALRVTINGEPIEIKPLNGGATLADVITHLGLLSDRIAVELDHVIVPRDRMAHTQVAESSRLEIVHFVGGGTELGTP